MKYISLFTGIGGFEIALQKVFPDSVCIGYSEVKPSALKIYQHHFPSHKNIGDITKITDNQIETLVKENGCDIIFGGFPCKNLSSLSCIKGGNSGLEGSKSGLFHEMFRIIKAVNRVCSKQVYVIFENNASMTIKNKNIITELIKEEYPDINMTTLDSKHFGVQCRNRIFWTNFNINKNNINCTQTWDDVLDEVGKNPDISTNYLNCLNKSIDTKKPIKKFVSVLKKGTNYVFNVNTIDDTYKSRWQMSFHSDTCTSNHQPPYTYPIGKCRPITASFGNHNVLVDRRCQDDNEFIVRMFSMTEIERLFGFEENYTILLPKSSRREVLGNSVVISVIEYIFNELKTILRINQES